MSPILTMQRRMRELGRIRMGAQEPLPGGRSKPVRLETFRLTSANREHLEAAAEAYGGTVRPWRSPRGPEFELVVEAPFLDVVIPPDVGVDPWLELWTGGGCVRRCDGVTESLSGQPCMCPADPKARQAAAQQGEACKPTTRLSVCLPALPDLGVWRLESHGYYAAVELSGMAEVLRAAALQGVMLPARLRIERRQVKRPNEPRKDFTVPVLEIPTRLGSLLPDGGPLSVPRIGAPAAAGLPALPAGPALPERSALRAAAAVPEEAEFVEVERRPTAGPLSKGAFVEALRVRGVDRERLDAAKDRLFPGKPQLSDEDRGELLADLACPALSDPRLGDVEACALAPRHAFPDGSPSPHQSAAGSKWPNDLEARP